MTPSETVKRLGKGKAHNLIVAELLQCLMDQWGGPSNFSKDFMTEYMAAKPGSIVRSRMLELVARLFISHTAQSKPGGDEFSSASDEELQNAAKKLFGEDNVSSES